MQSGGEQAEDRRVPQTEGPAHGLTGAGRECQQAGVAGRQKGGGGGGSRDQPQRDRSSSQSSLCLSRREKEGPLAFLASGYLDVRLARWEENQAHVCYPLDLHREVAGGPR